MTKEIDGFNKDYAKKIIDFQDKAPLSNPWGLNYTEKGTLRLNSVQNVVLILLNDKLLKGLFRFNEFTEEVDVFRDQVINLSKYNMPNLKFNKDQLTDSALDTLALYIETNKNYNVSFKIPLIDQAVRSVAKMNPYNPVIDYFEECLKNWDHKLRLFTFFPTYLGADNDKTIQLITRLWFMGLVAKAYNPNTKFDYVLDLVGDQGTGKTTLLQRIAPLGLYTDQFTDFRDKDNFEVMRNALIVNDDEMAASNKAPFAEVKKFITMQVFEYRKPYGHNTSRFKKKFVIARTTNEIRHLKDKSGDRRFLTILVHRDKQQKHPVTDLTQDYIDQLWGEVVNLYKQAKEPFKLTGKEENLLKENREQFMYTTPLEDDLNDRLDNLFFDRTFISNDEMADALFNSKEGFTKYRKEAKEIRYYMEHKGWITGAQQHIGNKVTRGFKKCSR